MTVNYELILRLVVALFFGAIIGFEREYRSKAAGFRTLAIITLGATLFTLMSWELGDPSNRDRIASNIITGIGFIGAGVIFKDAFSVSGITTAASIWIAAAIGMTLGAGEYYLAAATLVLAMIVLAMFEKIQDWIDTIHQQRTYRLNFQLEYETGKNNLEQHIKHLKIGFKIVKVMRSETDIAFFYQLSGNAKKLAQLTEYLIQSREIKSFEE